MARTKTEAAKSKAETAGSLASIGSAIGSVGGPVGRAVGGGLGAITGLIIGDQQTVFPIDMIAIPAYQSYLLVREPAFAIYIKEGEVLTQVVDTDAQEAQSALGKDEFFREPGRQHKERKKTTAYQRKYKAAFNRVKGQYKKKNGTWKKGGFRAAVKAAHKIAGGKK